ncbi:MAG: YbjQ family protein [Candidatus Obscuribacterales bacterium]|nr:YbjQ family protein [Candidatus Obscuribacterales bacterium]
MQGKMMAAHITRSAALCAVVLFSGGFFTSILEADAQSGYNGGKTQVQNIAPAPGQTPVLNQAPSQTFPIQATQNIAVPTELIVTTTPNVDGFRIREYRGIVRGVMVREPTMGQNFKAGFQGIFGGKIGAYTQLSEQGRQQAYDAMVQQAKALNANAVVNVRYDSDSFSMGNGLFASSVVCYGTAVMLEPAVNRP